LILGCNKYIFIGVKFQEGKLALMGANGNFVTLTEDDSLEAHSKAAGPGEMIKIRIPLGDSNVAPSAKFAKIN
jgi:hypothetical protein